MRRIIVLASAVVGLLAPMANAQSDATGTSSSVTPMGGMTTGYVAGPTDPRNCGTPDTFKKCPPMPRHPLQHYPAYR